jgi:hypothetical protein
MEDSFGFIYISKEPLETERGKATATYGLTTHKILIGSSKWWTDTSKAFKRSVKILIHETLHHAINITEGEEASIDMDNVGFFDATDPEFPYWGSSKGFQKKKKSRKN